MVIGGPRLCFLHGDATIVHGILTLLFEIDVNELEKVARGLSRPLISNARITAKSFSSLAQNIFF